MQLILMHTMLRIRMKRPARALYRILVCTALLVLGVRASDDFQNAFMDHTYEEPMSSIQNAYMDLLPEYFDDLPGNSVSSAPKAQLVSMCTEDIEYSSCLPSSSTILHKHDMDQTRTYTEQTSTLSSFYSTFCELDIECPPVYCIPNELVQKHTESESLGTYEQSSKAKRHKKAIEENTPRKKQKKTNKNSLDSDSTDNDVLDSSKIIRIKKNISIWKNSKLKNKHRESQHLGYKPAVAFDRLENNKYKEIGDKMHQSLIETYVKHCKAVYSKIPAQNEFWFAIASRTSRVHTKLADCKVMNANPTDYKFIEGLGGYYPGLPGDIVGYMDKHGPIVNNQNKIQTEWNETLGDIHVRKSAELEYAIGKETISYETCKEYRPVATAVRMILGLPEVHKDLSNHTAKFVENTLKDKRDSNHLAVVRELHEIVAKKKSLNKSNIDKQYVVLCNIFGDMLHQTDVLYESIVVQLYAKMYKSLVYFYEKAEVCEEILGSKKKKTNGEKKYYLLAGKCIIKPQRYLKCTTDVDLNKPVSEYKHMIAEETYKWSIPSDIEKHYHIHYVDNTKQKYTRVCMPMCSDRHMHTITQTIEHLKILYQMEKNGCIYPYKRNSSGDWKYIQEKEKDKTMQEFAECDIVFYHIEEGLKERYFTFAEFESYTQPKERAVRIPLFLSPLMRSAVGMGPFEKRGKEEHTVVNGMQSMRIQPSVYMYKKKYKDKEYSHVHYYYSNLYIRRDNADVPTIDCYIMDSKTIMTNDTAIVEWYAKIPNSANEYTHCILSDELMNDQDKYDKFSKAAMSQEYTPDSILYGFGLQSRAEKTSMLDGVGCSTYDFIDQNSIANYKLSIMPIHKTPTNSKIADIQSKIDELDREIKQINMEIKEPGTTEEQKKELRKKRHSICVMKSKSRQKLKKIQPEDQPLIEEEFSATIFSSCASFLVFRHSNTQTKSGLGAHNEILDAMSCRYNSGNK